MGTINIVKTIKLIHLYCMVIVKIGSFYNVYGKDAYIVSSFFIKKRGDVNIGLEKSLGDKCIHPCSRPLLYLK